MSKSEKRRITAQDLYDFQLINDAEISPNGQHVVYTVQRVDQESEKKYSNLWIVPTAGGVPTQFTVGDHVDSHPRWSPDGDRIAFLSNRKDEKQSQLYIIPFQGGEARQITEMKGEFGAIDWSPQGDRILCGFRKKDEEVVEREQDEKKKKLGVVSRHINRVFYKLDGQGYLPRERWHLWVVEVESGETRQITDGDVHDEVDPSWSPDGQQVVYVSNYAQDPDLEPDLIDLYIVSARGGEPRRLGTPVGPNRLPVFSPDGESIAYLGKKGKGERWKNMSLWVIDADGESESRNLTGHLDVDLVDATLNDLPGGLPLSAPVWSRDGSSLFVLVSEHGKTELKSVAVDGDEDELETVVGGNITVGAVSADEDRSHFSYLQADLSRPAEVWVHDYEQKNSRTLTDVNGSLLEEVDLGTIEEAWVDNGKGTEIQGWILTPPGFDPSKSYPSILEIHGGPRTQYGYLFMHEFYFLAAQDYVVYFTNPRGSRGYGEDFSEAVINDWGAPAYEDLMAWVDYMEEQSYIDPDRMGITGGSYGGYMTVWAIGHTDRFRAAVTQRCVSNWISMYGSSDVNWAFQQEFGDTPPWESFDNYWRLSPIKYIGNATTPTQVIHSERDLRCPIEQGEQVFVSLKKQGVDSEMIRFPEEPHGLSRGGRTDRRVERLQHMLRWFDRYLKDE